MTENRISVTRELTAEGLEIRGVLPPGLSGTLYRNGPNPRFPGGDAHWFLGDGMVHAMTLGPGGASYRNRWVVPAGQARLLGKANTNIIRHGGRMMALEEAHAPVMFDPHPHPPPGATGPMPAAWHVGTAPFTAHPKHDPHTGELVFFGYAADGPWSDAIRCGTLAPSGRLTWETRIRAPFCSMIHDMAVTPDHVLLPVLALVGRADRTDRSGFGFAWQPELGGRLALLRRGGDGRDVRWFDAPPGYAFHIVNAWEEGGRLFLDLLVYDEPPLFPRGDGAPCSCAGVRPQRWSVPLDGPGEARVTALPDVTGEFPRIDERFAGSRHARFYLASRAPGGGAGSFHAITRMDAESGEGDGFDFGTDASVSEPVFVPRAPDAARDEGWLLAVAWRPDWRTSRLVVFDAGHIVDGPVATVILPQRVPDGFHGNFIPDAHPGRGIA
ncbi:carotenoid oxygenase family protein [Novacetimonas pomaceti]|uniref:Dioxygenase n=1 Tax=Novacetimonas pomaceti TaxID=2021998 RepID=A0A318Q893_9PROT|nr:carotenoid oxygenase family protein [Novacetimonas pomaceti]PYD75075.1 hypothetical protein CFR71_11305 [Novacetimonas pomaceti]